jgi:hypothetical protein
MQYIYDTVFIFIPVARWIAGDFVAKIFNIISLIVAALWSIWYYTPNQVNPQLFYNLFLIMLGLGAVRLISAISLRYLYGRIFKIRR